MKISIFAICLLTFIHMSSQSQDRIIKLKSPNDKSFVRYTTDNAVIKVGLTEVLGTLISLKSTKWYTESDTSRKKRVDNVINDYIQRMQSNSLSEKSTGLPTTWTYPINEWSENYSGDSILIKAFKHTIGISILLNGNATVNKPNRPLENEIHILEPNKDSLYTIIFTDKTPVINGFISKISNIDSILNKSILPLPADSESQDSSIYSVAYKMPSFPNGLQSFYKKVAEYEIPAKLKKRVTRLFVQMIVEKDGSIKRISISPTTEINLTNKIKEAIKSCGKWNPAEHDGKFVRARIVIPIYL